jgi:hypothetical protein
MHKHKSLIIIIIGSIILVAGMSVALAMTRDARSLSGSSEELLALATCLSDKGATFYGAFWCPHCQEQKSDFGDAAEVAPYVECATLGGTGQTEACKEAGITSYPTWVFPNGERATGRLPLAQLAQATGCPAPTSVAPVAQAVVPMGAPTPTPEQPTVAPEESPVDAQ